MSFDLFCVIRRDNSNYNNNTATKCEFIEQVVHTLIFMSREGRCLQENLFGMLSDVNVFVRLCAVIVSGENLRLFRLRSSEHISPVHTCEKTLFVRKVKFFDWITLENPSNS